MKVTLEQFVGTDAVGGDVPHAIYCVYVEHEALHKYTPTCRVHVGYIGTHAGANFCPLPPFMDLLGEPNRQAVIAEVKRLHGAASPATPMELPEPLEALEEELPEEE